MARAQDGCAAQNAIAYARRKLATIASTAWYLQKMTRRSALGKVPASPNLNAGIEFAMMTASLLARRIRQFGVVLAAALLLGGAYVGSLRLTGNFNPVVAGELYRSGQLSSSEIASFAKEYGIKTIINLRGDNSGQTWYDAEVAEARELGVAHLDFRMSARRELSATQAADLVALMKQAEKPLLIHCQAGADRSGLAAALYLAVVKKESPAQAAGQLSFRYGHFSLPFVPEYAMDRSFEALRPSLAALAR